MGGDLFRDASVGPVEGHYQDEALDASQTKVGPIPSPRTQSQTRAYYSTVPDLLQRHTQSIFYVQHSVGLSSPHRQQSYTENAAVKMRRLSQPSLPQAKTCLAGSEPQVDHSLFVKEGARIGSNGASWIKMRRA